MKSLNLYGVEDLRFETNTAHPILEKETDVIIKIKAVGICGSDLSRYKKLGPYVPGMTWGHEFAGEIVEVGKKVKNVKLGDRVAGCPAFICQDLPVEDDCFYCKKSEFARCENLTVIGARHPGAFAEYIRLPSKNVIKLTDNISYSAGAIVEPACVVAHGLYRCDIKAGNTFAIIGCGNIGILSIKWARILGASSIIAIDVDEKALEIAKQSGADVVINPKEEKALDIVKQCTKGLGADVVIESAGSPITSAQVFAYAKKGGSVLFMGIPYGDVMVERFYFEKIVRSELNVYGVWNAISGPFPGQEWNATVHFLDSKLLDVESMITHKLNLEDGPVIFDKITHKQSGDHYGKVIFYPEGITN